MLSDQVAARLRSHGLKCCGVALSIRDPDFRDITRQCHIQSPTNLSREISRYAWELATECWNMSHPVRALTVTALSPVPEEEAVSQLDLLGGSQDQKREKLERLENTMDAIRARFGTGAISPASAPMDPGKERHSPPPGGHHGI
jgi:DNA polymerase-4